MHADLGNPISWLAVHWHVATIEAYVPHAACGQKYRKDVSGTRNALLTTVTCTDAKLNQTDFYFMYVVSKSTI